jgi:hypothetical protein
VATAQAVPPSQPQDAAGSAVLVGVELNNDMVIFFLNFGF